MAQPYDEESATPPPLWRQGDYLRWLTADFLGDLGSSMRSFAMPLIAVAIGASASAAGLTSTAGSIAVIIALLPGGVVADRLDRQRLIILGHGLRALLFALAVLAWHAGVLSVPLLALIATCSGLLSGFFGVASDAAMKHVVAAEGQLPAAVAANQARSSLVQVLASPISGLLMLLSPALPLLAEAIGHAGAALCVGRIRAAMRPQSLSSPEPSEPHGPEDAQGRRGAPSAMMRNLRELSPLRDAVLYRLLLACALGSFVLTGLMVALTLQWRAAGVSTGRIGGLMMISSLAMLAGSAVAPAVTRRLSGGLVLVVGAALFAGSVAASALSAQPLWQAAALGVGCLVLPAWNSVSSGYMMFLIPAHLMGRAGSIIQLLTMGLAALAPAAAGLGLDHLGWRATLLTLAATAALLIPAITTSPALRHLPTPSNWEAHR